MNLQLQSKHISGAILKTTQCFFLIPNLFITDEMGSNNNNKKYNTQTQER